MQDTWNRGQGQKRSPNTHFYCSSYSFVEWGKCVVLILKLILHCLVTFIYFRKPQLATVPHNILNNWFLSDTATDLAPSRKSLSTQSLHTRTDFVYTYSPNLTTDRSGQNRKYNFFPTTPGIWFWSVSHFILMKSTSYLLAFTSLNGTIPPLLFFLYKNNELLIHVLHLLWRLWYLHKMIYKLK